jgi:flagellar biosynthesis/type III secretory pathway protein FliH
VRITRARVLPRSEAAAARPLPPTRVDGTGAPDPGAPRVLPRARVLARPLAEARIEAAALRERAREDARQIVAHAETTARDISLQQQARARADALCLVVVEALELRKRQAELSRDVLDRSIGLSTLLAERLLGEELTLSPERVRALARQVLEEAAGARHAILIAHPRDASELRSNLASLGSLLDSIGVEEDPQLSRGHIRVETELGVIEADLKGQLERLSTQLKKLLAAQGG